MAMQPHEEVAMVAIHAAPAADSAAPGIPVAIAGEPKDIKAKIYELGKGADVVIVDTPGVADSASITATSIRARASPAR